MVAIRCAVTTINATVGGGVTSILYTQWRTNRRLIIPEHVINGILGSLVAITPTCACVNTYVALPIGAIGALVALGANTFICHCRIDDPVGAVGVHAGAGAWGLLAVGLFADSKLIGINVMDGLFRGGGFKLLGLQVLAIAATVGWALIWSTCFFYIVGVSLSRDWTDPRKGLRVDAAEEERGADYYLHGVVDHQSYAERTAADGASLDGDEDPRDDTIPEENHEKKLRRRLPSLTRKSDMYLRPEIETGCTISLQLSESIASSEDRARREFLCGERRSSCIEDIYEEEGEEDDSTESAQSFSEKLETVVIERAVPKAPIDRPRRNHRAGVLGLSMTSNSSNNASNTAQVDQIYR